MKMEIFGPLILSFIAGISTIFGALLIFLKIKKIDNFIVFCLSFSLAIMSLVSIFDLLPSSIPLIINNYGIYFGIIIVILVFMLGYLSIYKINMQIEKGNNNNSSLFRIGLLSMISLMLHNLPEGIAVFVSAYTDINIGIKICIAIMLHNIPEDCSPYVSHQKYNIGLKLKTTNYNLYYYFGSFSINYYLLIVIFSIVSLS